MSPREETIMGQYVRVAAIQDVPEGSMRKVESGDVPVLLVNVKGTCYAVAARCPHMGGDLSKGTLDGTVVQCPRHGSRFDVKDGHVVRWMHGAGLFKAMSDVVIKQRPLTTYPVRIDGSAVMVELPRKAVAAEPRS
jgi:3-phenylpropionate/trans-cinnamate dioxygenase ferredoxin subunit